MSAKKIKVEMHESGVIDTVKFLTKMLNEKEACLRGVDPSWGNHALCALLHYNVGLGPCVVNIADLPPCPIKTYTVVTRPNAKSVSAWSILMYMFSYDKEGPVVQSIDFPVGGSIQYYRENESGTHWQNPRRWELAEFLIAKFSAILDTGYLELEGIYP